MLDELTTQISNAPGNDSWTSGPMLVVIGLLALFGISVVVTVAIFAGDALATIGVVAAGLGGAVLGIIAVFVLLYNFIKILRELGFM